MFNTDELWDFIGNYDFTKSLQLFHEEFIKNAQVQAFVYQNTTTPFILFVNDFWSNPEASHERLKQKHFIPSSIPFSAIIKAFPSRKYIEYLKFLWNCDTHLALVRQKYLFTDEYISELACPIEFPSFQNDFCTNCLESNTFMYEMVINKSGYFTYQMYCRLCGFALDETLTNKVAKRELKKIINGFTDVFPAPFEGLNLIQCPDCNGKLRCKMNTEKRRHEVSCTRCNFVWNR